MTKIIHTEKAPAAIGPYVQAVDLGNLVLTSGQIPVNPATGEVPKDIVAQARQSLENVKAIIEQAGLKEGDTISVKLVDIDAKTGKFKLSHKVLLQKPEGY